MDFFLFKKLIAVVAMPMNIAILLLLLALIFFKSKPSLAIKSIYLSFISLLICAMPPISNTIVSKMEGTYESFTVSSTPIDYIIILGCGHQTNDALAITSQLKPCSLQRLVEGIRIAHLHPEATIIASGFAGSDPVANAEKVKQAAIALGIPSQRIITESYPRDTQEEAELISPRVKGTHVVLVTDAYHLPRAMKYFEIEGVNPIPAPAGYFVKDPNAKMNWLAYFPTSKALHQTSIIWYEKMGQIWQWIVN